MKKYENGQFIEMTEEEIQKFNMVDEFIEPTFEERLEALEAALLEQILGGSL